MKINPDLSSQFPNIYRIITENKYFKPVTEVLKKLYFQALLAGLFIFVMGFILLTALNFDKLNNLLREKKDLEGKVKIWEDITKKYPGHKEAYFQTALTHFRLKNYAKANEYIDKALFVDPDFEEAKILKKTIEDNY